ncbi:dapper homolog 1 [Ornithorhynchus anatinus]|uniref:Dishevelled binding antagonist of beta catenin 1 n=1 Tax=Ornithorhynchus anatinus TaxID=9258 RepID=A0A6I8N2T5_ORNAN|nr:dapper homolog 1 [Ornithorhynchus anatinus]
MKARPVGERAEGAARGGQGEAAAERRRPRERLEATLAGLAELDYLRQRQELLVRSVLRSPPGPGPGAGAGAGDPPVEAAQRSRLEEKFLEENILLLRKQLNCLRRRDAGLLSQLQELDKQISDLRLDGEKTAEERLETDSRPSSGFYELSDGTSGSLSNSSNSVFSECLSSCPSSSCFCSPLETSLNLSDGRPKSADLIGWLDCREGQCEEQVPGGGCRSPSSPRADSLDVVADVNPKFQCDLVSKNGNDVYRYPSPLHAVAVQSPMFLLPVPPGGPPREGEPPGLGAGDPRLGAEPPAAAAHPDDAFLLSPSTSWPAPGPPSSQKMAGYILSLVQRKVQPVRTNKPRTSVSADPAKAVLRHGSVCVRPAGGGPLAHGIHLPGARPASETAAFSSPQPRPWAREPKGEPPENRRAPAGCPAGAPGEPQGAKHATPELPRGSAPGPGDPPKESPPPFPATPKDGADRGLAPLPENRAVQPPKRAPSKNGGQGAPRPASPAPAPVLPPAPAPAPVPAPALARLPEERPTAESKSRASPPRSPGAGRPRKGPSAAGPQRSTRPPQGSKHARGSRSSTPKVRAPTLPSALSGVQAVREKGRVGARKGRLPDDSDTNRRSKKPSARGRRAGGVPPEAGRPGRSPGAQRPGTRAHGPGRDALVAKPKHKRADYQRWRPAAEASFEDALRRARRNRREAVAVALPGRGPPPPLASPYAFVASDSEYSAECESLFHSTVVDTSEDERSNYTTNCFGDSESSVSEAEFGGDSTTTSDSEESGGLLWSQLVQTLPELPDRPPETFVKIKASHNLKKKILRFRSGSLKLMTTV